MRIPPLVLWTALSVLCLTQTSAARSLVEPLEAPESLAEPGNVLPAFVSPGRLGEFLSAVREATFIMSERRTAAETLSAKFSEDAQVKSDVSERQDTPATFAGTGIHAPYIFEAALFEPSLLESQPTSVEPTKRTRRHLVRRVPAQRPRALSYKSAPRPARRPASRDNNGQLSKAELRWLNG
jgi:hypothetical protein